METVASVPIGIHDLFTQHEFKELESQFLRYTDRNHALDHDSVINIVGELKSFKSMSIPTKDMRQLLEAFDVDGIGMVNFEEFLCCVSSLAHETNNALADIYESISATARRAPDNIELITLASGSTTNGAEGTIKSRKSDIFQRYSFWSSRQQRDSIPKQQVVKITRLEKLPGSNKTEALPKECNPRLRHVQRSIRSLAAYKPSKDVNVTQIRIAFLDGSFNTYNINMHMTLKHLCVAIRESLNLKEDGDFGIFKYMNGEFKSWCRDESKLVVDILEDINDLDTVEFVYRRALFVPWSPFEEEYNVSTLCTDAAHRLQYAELMFRFLSELPNV